MRGAYGATGNFKPNDGLRTVPGETALREKAESVLEIRGTARGLQWCNLGNVKGGNQRNAESDWLEGLNNYIPLRKSKGTKVGSARFVCSLRSRVSHRCIK